MEVPWYDTTRSPCCNVLQYMCCEVVCRVDMCDDVCYVVSQKVEGVRVGMKAKQASKGGERWHSW